jgi:hypothetical protein
MKELFKYLLGLIILIGVAYVLISRIFTGEILPTQNNVAKIIDLDNTPAAISQDKNGNTHAQKEIIYLTNFERELVLSKEVDSLKAILGVKDNQIIGLTTAVSKFQYEIKYTTDTTKEGEKRYTIDQSDRWFSAKGIIPGPDPIMIEGRDSITVAFINKGRKRYADISSQNKAIQYYGLRSFMIPDQAKNGFGIGLNGTSILQQNLRYKTTNVNVGVKFMHIGSKWMYDAGAGYGYLNLEGSKFHPFITIGVYKKLF